MATDKGRFPHAGVQVHIYTDGGQFLSNPGPGGWGAILTYRGHYLEMTGASDESVTTNNRMELLAAIVPLGFVRRAESAVIVTDASYVARGINTWFPDWKERGLLAPLAKVPNADLWGRLYDVYRSPLRLSAVQVKGHAGHPLNERADKLAGLSARERWGPPTSFLVVWPGSLRWVAADAYVVTPRDGRPPVLWRWAGGAWGQIALVREEGDGDAKDAGVTYVDPAAAGPRVVLAGPAPDSADAGDQAAEADPLPALHQADDPGGLPVVPEAGGAGGAPAAAHPAGA